MLRQYESTFVSNRNTTARKISRLSIGVFARRMEDPWMSDMRGIDDLIREVSALQASIVFGNR